MRKITVGVLTPYNDSAEALRTGIASTGMATRVVLSSEYVSSKSDRSARRLIEAAPEIIIVEVREPAPALRSLHVLHSALPNTRLLIASTSTDPQLIIEAMHSGAREFLPLPASNAALLQAFNRHVAENELAV